MRDLENIKKQIADAAKKLKQIQSKSGIESDLPSVVHDLGVLVAGALPHAQNELMEIAKSYYDQGNVLIPETIWRAVRKINPSDFESTYRLAEMAGRLQRYEDAVDFLVECVRIKPNLPVIHLDLAEALLRSGNYSLALSECNAVLEHHPEHFASLAIKAEILVKLAQYDDALALYHSLTEVEPNNAGVQMRLGQLLRMLGKKVQSRSAFRQALKLDPELYEAYWHLVSLGTNLITPDDEALLKTKFTNAKGQNRVFLAFVLGRVQESQKNYQAALDYYAEGKALNKKASVYNPMAHRAEIKNYIDYFNQERAEKNFGSGHAGSAPIFIVGLPRSGSTLLEQILGSHSQVDASAELTEISAMVKSLSRIRIDEREIGYPEVLDYLSPTEIENFGKEYLTRTAGYRKNGIYFTDKAPHNFLYIGLIKAILPQAKIIDARRNPMATGFSIYRQYFPQGFSFTNDLYDIGRYYADYMKLMHHWKELYPDEILTVDYEKIVSDPENETRRLLKYCGLDFEQNCIDFYKNERPVATISSEQVRQPIYTDSLTHWEHFEAGLEPLKQGLEEA